MYQTCETGKMADVAMVAADMQRSYRLVLRGQTAFLPQYLSIGNYKFLLEKGLIQLA